MAEQMNDIRLEQAAKAIAVIVGLSYGIGIVVSNIYLASMGVMDFDLLRPKAVLSGLWFMSFFAVALVAEESIQRAYQLKNISPKRRLGNALIALLGALIFYFIPLTLLQPFKPGKTVLASLVMFVSAAGALTEMQNAVKEWRRRKTDEKVGPTAAAFFVFHCSWAVVLLFLFAFYFVTYFYRLVPQQYGGDRPSSVEIAVSDKAAQVLNGMSVVTSQNVIKGSVDLIHETSENIAFRPNGGQTIILPQRELLAIRVK